MTSDGGDREGTLTSAVAFRAALLGAVRPLERYVCTVRAAADLLKTMNPALVLMDIDPLEGFGYGFFDSGYEGHGAESPSGGSTVRRGAQPILRKRTEPSPRDASPVKDAPRFFSPADEGGKGRSSPGRRGEGSAGEAASPRRGGKDDHDRTAAAGGALRSAGADSLEADATSGHGDAPTGSTRPKTLADLIAGEGRRPGVRDAAGAGTAQERIGIAGISKTVEEDSRPSPLLRTNALIARELEQLDGTGKPGIQRRKDRGGRSNDDDVAFLDRPEVTDRVSASSAPGFTAEAAASRFRAPDSGDWIPTKSGVDGSDSGFTLEQRNYDGDGKGPSNASPSSTGRGPAPGWTERSTAYGFDLEVADLVDEALIEQAKLRGVDLE